MGHRADREGSVVDDLAAELVDPRVQREVHGVAADGAADLAGGFVAVLELDTAKPIWP